MDLERKMLQACILVGALVPITAGAMGAMYGGALTGETLSPSGDSHFRYLSGLLLGIGLAFWSVVPAIEHKTGRARLLTFIVVIGGLCRVAALRSGAWPSTPMLFGAVMEVLVTPALCLWQSRIARQTTATARPRI